MNTETAIPTHRPTRRRGSLSIIENHAKRDQQDSRAVLYIRVSTKDQENSVDAQETNATNYATFKHLEIAEIFRDIGESAVKKPFLTRPAAKKLLKFIKKEKINTILFTRPDRAFRNVKDCCECVKLFNDQGIRIDFIESQIDASTSEGRMTLQLMVTFAEWEGNLRAERQRDGYDEMRKKRLARSPTAIPYGWDLGGLVTSERGKKSHQLHPNPKEQATLHRMIRMRKSGRILEAIANHLNENGIKTKLAGKEMTRKGVTFTVSGIWKKDTVLSVLEHAELASAEELAELS